MRRTPRSTAGQLLRRCQAPATPRLVIGVLTLAFSLAGAAALAGGAAASGGPVLAQDEALGAQVYSDNCAQCHQATGLGVEGTFPPLAGNPNSADAAYVESTVRDGLSGPIEVLGVTYDGDMAAFGDLSDDEVAAVVAYVGTLADKDTSAPEPEPEVVEPGDIGEGRDLFIGSTRFAEGGGACSSCHTAGDVGNLGGWSLGPDLTSTHDDLGGDVGLSAWLSNPASATMRPIFRDNPMTEAEIADVVAFLADAPNQDEPTDPGDGLLYGGFAGLILLIGGMAIAWRGMRQSYMDRLRSKR